MECIDVSSLAQRTMILAKVISESDLSLYSVMLVTKKLEYVSTGGRELLCKLNHDVLLEVYGKRLVLFELPQSRIQGLNSFIKTFFGHIDGLNEVIITNALQAIKAENVGKVFVDGSNLGGIVKVIKQRLPHVEVCTFFHNVEARFFWGALKQAKTLRALAVLLVNYLAERNSVHYSDKLICLSQRDSLLLHKVYARSATHVSPIALQDKLPARSKLVPIEPPEKFALFVGGAFYANKAGISWFVKHVAPRVKIKTYIVGRGFEDLKEELKIDGRVEVVGAVDNLDQWYQNAHIVIAPIFDGSGMKTKVAEALMFGKKIIGTTEAFSGYEDIASRVGWQCESASDFIKAIEQAQDLPWVSFNTELRVIYERMYSFVAARDRLSMILDKDSLP
jgi:glycosyltransferase involved in cell wall biosynthesis